MVDSCNRRPDYLGCSSTHPSQRRLLWVGKASPRRGQQYVGIKPFIDLDLPEGTLTLADIHPKAWSTLVNARGAFLSVSLSHANRPCSAFLLCCEKQWTEAFATGKSLRPLGRSKSLHGRIDPSSTPSGWNRAKFISLFRELDHSPVYRLGW